MCYREDNDHCHEVYQYKHRKANLTFETLEEELSKGALDCDIFMWFVTEECSVQESEIPKNCAVVLKENWDSYYGPFSATMHYFSESLILINFASEEESSKVEKIGPKLAAEIVEERTKREFSWIQDAEKRLEKILK